MEKKATGPLNWRSDRIMGSPRLNMLWSIQIVMMAENELPAFRLWWGSFFICLLDKLKWVKGRGGDGGREVGEKGGGGWDIDMLAFGSRRAEVCCERNLSAIGLRSRVERGLRFDLMRYPQFHRGDTMSKYPTHLTVSKNSSHFTQKGLRVEVLKTSWDKKQLLGDPLTSEARSGRSFWWLDSLPSWWKELAVPVIRALWWCALVRNVSSFAIFVQKCVWDAHPAN